jgi:hypothetical protein
LAAWAVLGNKVSILLSSAQRIRVFNVLMGITDHDCVLYALFSMIARRTVVRLFVN